MKPPPPIPVPWRLRLHEARSRLLPPLVFGASVVALAVLWRENLAAPAIVGQAEPVLVNLASHKPGVLVGLTVNRFQKVKAGELIGQVLIADPKLLASSLAVIRAEIDVLQTSLSPIARRQQNAVNYNQLRLDWMKQRATLAAARVQLRLAEVELRRNKELFQEKIISSSLFDLAQATYDGYQQEVEELTRLVAEAEQNFSMMQPTGTGNLSQVSDEPVRAAIALQEARLRLVEEELAPVLLRAPMDGMVSAVFHRSGEAVTAGQPVAAISTLSPVRIVGYVRQPPGLELQAGMRVQVRRRSLPREGGEARILGVGSQLEAVPDAMASAIRFTGVELGLPVDISLPSNLKIVPGELVDITLLREGR